MVFAKLLLNVSHTQSLRKLAQRMARHTSCMHMPLEPLPHIG